MKMNRHKLCLILLAALLPLLATPVAGCIPNPRYIYENGSIQVGGDGEPIELIDNPDATNPTYAELAAFIRADATDTKAYLEEGLIGLRNYEPRVCADFAEAVHNNAEVAGIRAAWVSLYFEENHEGHALNAFETTDRGLVYIDCTGDDPEPFAHGRLLPPEVYIRLFGPRPPKPTSWDTVAYIELGEEYGLIDIAKAKSLSYGFYEEYKQKWQEYEKLLSDYNEEVIRYNQETRGKVYYEGSPELATIEAWETRLNEKGRMIDHLGEEIGEFWFEPRGVVKEILIHWGGAG